MNIPEDFELNGVSIVGPDEYNLESEMLELAFSQRTRPRHPVRCSWDIGKLIGLYLAFVEAQEKIDDLTNALYERDV